MKPANKRIFISFLLLLAATTEAPAQAAGSISGTVRDPHGNAIAGASAEIFARGGGMHRITTTNPEGLYHFDHLPEGAYIIQARARGFARYVTEAVRIDRGASLKVDLPLQLAGLEQQVVVTASGTPQAPEEVSKAITVIDRQAIDERDESAISEVLRTTPGLRVQQLGGPGAFTAIRIRGLRDQDTAVLIDGLRFRDPSSTQADASGLLEDLLTTNIDHLEVLRGSGSSLYGTNAIGGVINVLTDEGGGRSRGSALLEGGSLGMFHGRARFSGGTNDNRVQYSLGLAHLDVTSGLNDDPARNTSGQGRIAFRPSPGTQIVARFYGADSFTKLNISPRTIGNPPASGIIDARPLSPAELLLYENGKPLSQLAVGNATFIPSANDPDATRAARFASGALTLTGRPLAALGYTVSYQGLAINRTFGNGPAGPGFQSAGSTRSDFSGRIHTLLARFDYQPGSSTLLTGGYEFEDEYFATVSLDSLNSAAASAADVTQRSNTGFVQVQERLLDNRLEVSTAFRAQSFSLQRPRFNPAATAPYRSAVVSSSPAAYTGDGSIAWFLNQSGTKIRAHAGRGYRSPSLFERFGTGFDPDFGYFVYGDPRLRPERSIAVDGGIDQAFSARRLRTSLTYFYTRLQDVILFDPSTTFIDPVTDPFGRAGGYRNAKGGLARGVELSLLFSPGPGLDVSAAYTYTNAIERTPLIGDVLRSFITPNHQTSILVTQRMGRRVSITFDLTASSSYLAPISSPSRVFRFEGINKADLAGSYRIPRGELRAIRWFAKLSNLFNQNFYESGFRAPGITGLTGVQVEF